MLVPQSPAPAGAPAALPYQSPYAYQQPTIPAPLPALKQPFGSRSVGADASIGGWAGLLDEQPAPAATTIRSRSRERTIPFDVLLTIWVSSVVSFRCPSRNRRTVERRRSDGLKLRLGGFREHLRTSVGRPRRKDTARGTGLRP